MEKLAPKILNKDSRSSLTVPNERSYGSINTNIQLGISLKDSGGKSSGG